MASVGMARVGGVIFALSCFPINDSTGEQKKNQISEFSVDSTCMVCWKLKKRKENIVSHGYICFGLHSYIHTSTFSFWMRILLHVVAAGQISVVRWRVPRWSLKYRRLFFWRQVSSSRSPRARERLCIACFTPRRAVRRAEEHRAQPALGAAPSVPLHLRS